MNNSDNETTNRSPPSLEELSRRGVRSLFLPYIIGLVSNTSAQRSSAAREVLVLVNFRTGSISMVEGSGQIEEILREKEGPLPASKASIEGMPKVEVMEEGFECSICLTEFGAEFAKEMPCKHMYHSCCIDKWLGIHGSCPICRFQMPVEEEENNDDGESDGGDDGEGESGAGFVFHIYVAGSRRRESGLDSDHDTMNMENEDDGIGEGNSDSDSDMDIDDSN